LALTRAIELGFLIFERDHVEDAVLPTLEEDEASCWTSVQSFLCVRRVRRVTRDLPAPPLRTH
jgi:hypothetical protein